MESIGPPWRLEPGRQLLGLARDSGFPGCVVSGGENQIGAAARATAIAFIESGRCLCHGTRPMRGNEANQRTKAPWSRTRGRFLFGAGLPASCETFRTKAEGVGLALPGGKLFDSPLCFPSRHGLGVAWTRVEDHPPEPPGLGRVAPLLGQNGEVAQARKGGPEKVSGTVTLLLGPPVGTKRHLQAGQETVPDTFATPDTFLTPLPRPSKEEGLRSRISVPDTLSASHLIRLLTPYPP
jgi:hypothetical protein